MASNNRNVLSPSSGGQESEVEVSVVLFPSGGSEGDALRGFPPASGGSRKSLVILGL